MARRKLKILYSFPHPLGLSGTGRSAWHQAKGLVDQGFEVTICCSSLARDIPGAHRVVETMTLAGTRVPHRLLGVARTMRLHDWRTARWLERAGGGFDAVHGWPLASATTFDAARRLGIATLREVPNTHAEHLFNVVGREQTRLNLPLPAQHLHLYNRARLQLHLAEYEAADVILVPSEFAHETFTSRGVPEAKLAVHRYGFSPSEIPRHEPTERPSDSPFTMMFLARGEPRKGLHYALPAWANSGAGTHGRFLVVGTFIPGYSAALGRWLDDPSVERMVFQTEFVKLLRETDALVLPSVEEGSALVTYEAMACGCALLVSSVAGARCRHGHDALIHEPGDVATLTEHIRRLAGDADLRQSMRRNAAANYDDLTWDRAAEELADVYERTVQRHAASQS